MRAARYYAPQDVRIEEIPEPEPGPGQVKLAVSANGVCGSDLHEYFSAAQMVPSEPHPLTHTTAPVVFGHEFAGTITELGEGVADLAVGDRIAVRPTITCGHCPACSAGLSNVCQQVAFHGFSAPTGGLAEFSVVDADAAHRLPEDVDLELGALVEPMAVSYHATRLADLSPDDTAVICGLGPIGIGVYFALRAAGLERILLSDPSSDRRKIATEIGAEHVVDPSESDVAEVARELSDGRGARAAFDAAGVGVAIEQGLTTLAPQGRLVVIGLHEKTMQLQPTGLVLQELVMLGSGTYTDADFTEVIASMARGEYSTNGWVEHRPLDDLSAVLESLRGGQGVKVLIDA